MRSAGDENLLRLKSALRRDRPAMDALRSLGLHGATIERLHLGQKQPYVPRDEGREQRGAVSYPLLDAIGRPLGRYAYVNLPGVTVNPTHPKAWGPGACSEYRLGSESARIAVVCTDVVDSWLAWQCYCQGSSEVRILSRTAWGTWPAEWRSPVHWAEFAEIVLLPGDGSADFAAELAPLIDRDIRRFRAPPPYVSFAAMVVGGSAPSLDDLLAVAPADAGSVSDGTSGPVALGMFEAAPIDVSSGFAGGRLYHPVAVELRAVEGAGGTVVHRYRTMVVRSDGVLLSADLLPAPRGTASSLRVLALSDGTRIRGLPPPSPSGTWSYASIQDFVAWRRRSGPRPFGPLAQLLSDAGRHLRARVWLPDESAYQVVACFVAMTYVYPLFPALPILLALGPPSSGKSELGEAVAELSANGILAGQLRAAGMVRLLDESRGLLVLDDMDGTGQASIDGDGEIAMALKTGYKRSTSRKPLADRGGRIRMVDYFGPKMVTRTRAPTPILGSRMLTVATAVRSNREQRRDAPLNEEGLAGLRNEFHCWAMGSVDSLLSASDLIGDGEGDRWSEITKSLRVIAHCGGIDLDEALARMAD